MRYGVWLLATAIWLTGLATAWAGDDWVFTFERASETALSNPHDVRLSMDGRHLFVADVGSGNVVVLDADTLAQVGAFGGDILAGTHDIDLDATGRLFVADTHNGRIAVFRMRGLQGDFERAFGDRLAGPEGVLVHPNGLVYAAGAWSNNVVAYRDDGRVAYELRGLSAPHDLELAPDGRLWLADAGNDRILLLSERLEVLRELHGSPYDFDGVRYLDVLTDGTLIAADKYTHSIKVMSPGGELLAVLGTGDAGRGPGLFRTPEGVDSRADTLWIADSGNDRVVRYRFSR